MVTERPLDRVRRAFRLLHEDERGQAMTEYVVILCSIAVVSITVIGEVAEKLTELLGEAFDGLDVVSTNLD